MMVHPALQQQGKGKWHIVPDGLDTALCGRRATHEIPDFPSVPIESVIAVGEIVTPWTCRWCLLAKELEGRP